jgi:hypothetical protein
MAQRFHFSVCCKRTDDHVLVWVKKPGISSNLKALARVWGTIT